MSVDIFAQNDFSDLSLQASCATETSPITLQTHNFIFSLHNTQWKSSVSKSLFSNCTDIHRCSVDCATMHQGDGSLMVLISMTMSGESSDIWPSLCFHTELKGKCPQCWRSNIPIDIHNAINQKH